MEEGSRFLDSTPQQAYKRAGIDKVMHHIKGYSGDTASRSTRSCFSAQWTAPGCVEQVLIYLPDAESCFTMAMSRP